MAFKISYFLACLGVQWSLPVRLRADLLVGLQPEPLVGARVRGDRGSRQRHRRQRQRGRRQPLSRRHRGEQRCLFL